MAKGEHYKTKQKNLIIDIIKKQKKDFTIKDIYNELNGNVGLTTIYRLVKMLEEDGLLSKYIDKKNITFYQYLEKCNLENHFYLKCMQCGNIIHVDCDCIEEMAFHILKKHNFRLLRDHIIINGICQDCYHGEKID